MKKFLNMIALCLTATLVFCSVVGCAVDRVPQLPKLSVPVVTIDDDGVATWRGVTDAIYYAYVIDEGDERLTADFSVTLAPYEAIKVKAVSGNDSYTDSDFSKYVTYVPREVPKIKLDAPIVTVDGDGIATWNAIENAQYYVYVVNDGIETKITERTFQLADNQSFKVKACSDSDEYSDSDYSQLKTYVNGVVLTQLTVPQLSVNTAGVASWNVVADAQYYVYVIDNGAEVKTTERSVTLTDGQTIKVKAGSDVSNCKDSDYSQSVTYTAYVGPHSHVDANSDGSCDDCGKSVIAELSFLAVNDLHGKFIDTDNQPGVDEFTTYLKNLYADDAREEVLLSSGDMWQGTVESSTNKGKLMTEWMNDVGFVSMTLGNHEYDWGAAVLTPNSKLADFPFLAINVTYNGKAVDYCQPSVVVEKAGIKIGIIGAIGDCLSSISGDFTDGLKFATGSELTALVKAESTRLKRDEGCEFIVYSIHEGYGSETTSISDYYDESLSNGYIDLVFEGHTHQNYVKKDDYGVYHLQGGGENKYVSQADVSYNTVTKKYTVTPKTLSQNVYANSSLKDDPIVQQIFTKYFPDGNPYTTVLGNIKSQKYSETICADVAKLYYDKGVELWGSEYNIVLGGGFLRLRSPYKVAAGNVTYASLFSILPFDNDIVLGRIQGNYLNWKFLETTNSDYHIYSTISSNEVSTTSYYYIIVDSYTSSYASNKITEVKRWKSEKYARDLLADYVKSGGWA